MKITQKLTTVIPNFMHQSAKSLWAGRPTNRHLDSESGLTEKKSHTYLRDKKNPFAAKIMLNSFPRTLGNSCASSREILRKISGSWAVRRLSKYFLRKTLCRI